ncbi:MAG: pentapeptide repeat-containing protein [Aphanizomenon gracile PMC644.10]|nr:pentapeptide repeat-containing protein [Aphanizomenon gracile PMC644.10]
MANPEHLAILKQGVEVWNNWRDNWREENPDWVLTPDLSEADLRGADLNGADLNGANLREAKLNCANLNCANLFKTNLSGAYLFKTKLSGANLREANLNCANLNCANLFETNLSGADLNWAYLLEANLSGAYLFNANLSGANLSLADLNGTDLTRAKLFEAHLFQTNLNRANLSLADLSGADLTGSDLSEANLNGANLRCAKFTSADLFGSNLREAYLWGSQVIYANFQKATLTGAYIQDWLINNTTNLDGVICEYIYLDWNKKERRPINGNFEPGEFASLYKKIIENTDLIISTTLEKDNNIKNQGVQFYSNSTIHTWENLRFRSKTEIKIAEALDRAGVLFVPNSLARLNTSKGRENKEADFLICYNGKWGVLEVDGPFHTAERRVEEQERERIFKKNGIKVVERFDSERCYNNPDEVVQEFFKMIEIGYS